MRTDQQEAAPDVVTRRLSPNERLIWWDRPIPALAARHEFTFALLFGLFFVAFAVFWMSMASRAPGPFFLFGIPFVCFGLWIVSAPVRAYMRAGSTLCALTDGRALIITGAKVHARPLELVEFIETESFADGSGHIFFFTETSSFAMTNWNRGPAVTKSGFIAVADAERVGREMTDLMNKRRSRNSQPRIGTS